MKGMKYYVVYEVWQDGITVGKGTCEVLLKKRITDKKEVEEIENLILRDKNMPEGLNAVVVNWIYMDEVEVKDE